MEEIKGILCTSTVGSDEHAFIDGSVDYRKKIETILSDK